MANLEINIRQANADFVAIKEKIVEKGVEVANGTKTADYAQKVEEVYEAGKETINNEVELINNELEEVLRGADTGGKSYYDAFWDAYQDNGNRAYYGNAFAGAGWNDETFKPKYDIKPITDASRILSGTKITDFKGALEKAGVVFDLSKAVSISYITDNSTTLTRLPELNVTSAKTLQYFLYQASALVSVDKVILKSDGSQNFGAQSFGYLNALEEIRFEGVIGQNGLNFQQSKKLSKASITSIINALSTTTSELTITLSKVAVNKAFETNEGANDGELSAEWKALAGDKNEGIDGIRKNWTISLA